MKTETFAVNPFETNCFVYYDETASGGSKNGVIIDPGVYTAEEKEAIEKFISENGINIKLILITHGHIDHVMGNSWAKELFKAPILMHEADLPLNEKALEQGKVFEIDFPAPPAPDKFTSENDMIEAGDTQLKVIHTPGHSPGGVCFVDEKNKVIFGGDCIFKGSIGRTDLWEGDKNILLDSIDDKILTLGDDYIIYPGHYEKSTIGEEKKNNPFLNGEVDGYV